MKAIVYKKYGDPEVLKLEEVEKPKPKKNEVLVKLHAASVNSWDWDLLRGKPLVIRLNAPFRPKHKILGCDIAGVVEEVGAEVDKFKVGQAVFGDISSCAWGGYAEYVCVKAKALELKPEQISFVDAATLPQSAVMAWQGLQDYVNVKPGHKILVNGAGGCVGPFAVQMAKNMGAEVTAVDSKEKFAMLKSIGADYLIDYKQQDFTGTKKKYDLIIENIAIAQRPIRNYIKALEKGGTCIIVGGSMKRIFQVLYLGPLYKMLFGKRVRLLMHNPNKNLSYIAQLVADKKIHPVINDTYPLNKVGDAINNLAKGLSLGKNVIKISE